MCVCVDEHMKFIYSTKNSINFECPFSPFRYSYQLTVVAMISISIADSERPSTGRSLFLVYDDALGFSRERERDGTFLTMN